jgi:PPM family protein phosphatase
MFAETKQLKQVSGWCLDKGLQRENNEDYLGIAEISQTNLDSSECIGIYVLADGMGGLEDGERASYTAVRAATQSILQQAQNHESNNTADCHTWLQKAMNTAHSIQRTANARRPHYESGTTLVVALMIGNSIHVSNVGDSRAYIISHSEIRQISKDHNFVTALVDAGAITKEEAIKSPFRHTLTQAIGIDAQIEPTLVSEEFYTGDFLLLCSDGLYSLVDEGEIAQIIQSSVSLQLACDALVDAANAAGGEDNIAVILVQLQES